MSPTPFADKARIEAAYAGLVPPDRLRVISLENAGSGFWTRDGFPIPVWSASGGMDMVDNRYYHGFEPDDQLRGMFNNFVYSNDYYYEGGNFMVKGDCLMVDNNNASANDPG